MHSIRNMRLMRLASQQLLKSEKPHPIIFPEAAFFSSTAIRMMRK